MVPEVLTEVRRLRTIGPSCRRRSASRSKALDCGLSTISNLAVRVFAVANHAARASSLAPPPGKVRVVPTATKTGKR